MIITTIRMLDDETFACYEGNIHIATTDKFDDASDLIWDYIKDKYRVGFHYTIEYCPRTTAYRYEKAQIQK